MSGDGAQSVAVLRLGHRPSRDKRVSTHLILAARAFGASKAYYTGEQDDSLEESIRKVVADWGGEFTLQHATGWKRVFDEWDGKIVHLTMYGVPFQDAVPEIRADPSPKLVVVGGAKVPGEIYGLVQWNVAVTNQPHSEVSALALFLHELYGGKELDLDFPGARLKVVPQEKGKRIQIRTKQV
jgi:tRNA (cytidine56-2'-O)-methyltransferase